ncbi:MAG: hypothetical protein JSV65_11215 [Armatimonadota bacterium]|nr:MAG: hypothetical protein JSV65_11215 [Armatimonadota bacterium]
MKGRARLSLHAVLVAFFLVAGCGCAQAAGDSVNVKDFGAQGDGVADDTAAIQAAIDEAQKRARSEPYPGGPYYVTSPAVVFPSGKYVISDTVNLAGTVIRGEGYAVIEQRDPDKDVVRADWAWRMTIEGLTFVGGRSHVSLANPNLDTGLLVIRDCRFYGSAGPAVEFRAGTNSTLAVISNCIFVCCRQALITHTDETAVRDCWITSSIEMRDQAVIEHRGARLVIDHLVGVPLVNGHDQRWIDNHGANLTCVHCRFGGEGAGFTPVVNFTRFTPQAFGSTILLDDCFVAALGNNARACAVYCEEVPNGLEVRDCILTGVPAVVVDESIDLNTYFRGARPGMLKFALANNTGEMAGTLPEGLADPVLAPAAAAQDTPAMSPADTREALARAREFQLSRTSEPAPPSEFGGHRQQTAPAKFIEITPTSHQWDLDDHMDATTERNSAYLALAPAADDVIIMRRRPSRGNWPHVLIRNVAVDLDRYPYLTWKQKDSGTGAPATHAVKVLHKATGTLLLLREDGLGANGGSWHRYYAYNLKELFGLEGGEHVFDIKFYYLGIGPGATSDPTDFTYAQPGDYIVLDFLRLESD